MKEAHIIQYAVWDDWGLEIHDVYLQIDENGIITLIHEKRYKSLEHVCIINNYEIGEIEWNID